MSYASILVHVEANSPSSDARLALSSELARRFGAALIGVAAESVRPPMVDAFGGAVLIGDVLVAEEEQIRARLEAAEKTFGTHSGVEGLTTEWRSAVDLPASVVAQEARAADLIVLGRDLERLRAGVYQAPDPGEVVMAAGRPVLVVPPDVSRLSARHVLIAWRDVREARRAVVDALPFLAKAEGAHLVEVAEEADRDVASARVSDVVGYLERHQVRAEGEVRVRREATTADEVILAAEQSGADLIVAGAYGHARMREWVFGGVTRDLLHRCPMCCLLSH